MNKIDQLKKLGFTKWQIKNYVGVKWNTVHMWDKGIFKPKPSSELKLDEMINSKS